jgi:hypothetical protein
VAGHPRQVPPLREEKTIDASAPELRDLRARNERIVRSALAAYIGLLSIVAIADGVQLTPDVLFVAGGLVLVAVAWRLSTRRGWSSLRDWSVFLIVGLAYELIRAFGPFVMHNVHVGEIVAIERTLFDGYVASELLQDWLQPAAFGAVALVATGLYVAHSGLPIVVAAVLWHKDRAIFLDFIAAFVVLSMAAFATYVILPAAPPWWAATMGHLLDGWGQAAVIHLEPGAIDGIAASAGLSGQALSAMAFGDISPDPVAAFPSLHAAYPFLAYLFMRLLSRRLGRFMLLYTFAVWFSIVYLGDHYVIDIVGGVVYALAAYTLVRRPARLMALLPRLAPAPATLLEGPGLPLRRDR